MAHSTAGNNLTITGGVIRFEPSRGAGWDLPEKDLVIVGEYTTPEGPLREDHFIVFVDRDQRIYAAPFDAHGVLDVLNTIDPTKHRATATLANSTTYDSKVMWPIDCAGKPLFEFDPVPATGVVERFKRWVGYKTVSERLSDTVIAAVRNARQPRSDAPHRALRMRAALNR